MCRALLTLSTSPGRLVTARAAPYNARMTDHVVRPVTRPIDASVRLPGSKSLSNRALLLAALAEGRTQIDRLLFADDTRLMIDGLRGLGVAIAAEEDAARGIVVGCGGAWPNPEADLFCGNAGTVARFLTAACCLGHGAHRIDGVERMRHRPIGPLVDALNDLGAAVACAGADGFLPLNISARSLRGGTVSIRQPPSSQFLSALLLVAPLACGDVMIRVDGPLPSAPFVRMTLHLMDHFGVAFVEQDLRRFIVPGTQHYAGRDIQIEPDATAASYFFAAAALTGGRMTIEALGRDSVQGDLGFLRVLEQMGCRVEQNARHTTVVGPPEGRLRGVDADLSAMPDVAQTLAVLAVFAEDTTVIHNVANLRIKETDRLFALATELQKLGAEVEIRTEGLTIHPPHDPRPSAIATYDDHRMAMSFALAGLRLDGIVIQDAECVSKTFPAFFEEWDHIGGAA